MESLAMSERGVVYLMYHELERPGYPLCHSDQGYARYAVEEECFRSQMQWLQQAGWRGLGVGEALATNSQVDDPRPSIVLTFDDGCESDLITAAPILKAGGFDATFYITVTF